MPEEVAGKQRKEAYRFHEIFTNLSKEIDLTNEIKDGEIKPFVHRITEEIKRFVEYKKIQQEDQETGKLRSLVWPLFFEHAWREGERWNRRLEKLAQGYFEYEEKEVVPFWVQIMEEHARFIAHLLDPDEYDLIEMANKTSGVFKEFQYHGKIGGTVTATMKHPDTVVKSLSQNPEIDPVLSAAKTILDFKTEAVRGIEGAKIKSIIDPRLADHVRREALKFVNELNRLA